MTRAGILGDIADEVETTVGKATKQIQQLPSDLQQTASQQVSPPPDQGTNEQGAGQKQSQQTTTDQATQEVVQGLYAPSQKPVENKKQSGYIQGLVKKGFTLEEAQKLEKLRKELHDKYYQDLVNRPKPKEEQHAVRVEKKDQENRMELQEKKKKKLPPIAVDRAKNKTERFPGVSG